jgi:hypothetical protein
MRTWSELHEVLQNILGEDGKAYFQPPENLKLKYPCIVFDRSGARILNADNLNYQITKSYTITLITKTADNDKYLDKLLQLPMCTFDREFITDGLVHEVFSIYF